MQEHELLRRIGRINVWSQKGQRAPHKPLLLLYALGRLAQNKSRLVSFRSVKTDLSELLVRFGPSRRTQRPEEPFKRLPTDHLWELQSLLPSGSEIPKSASSKFLIDCEAKGGFTSEIFDTFQQNPILIEKVSTFILESHFPRTYHDDIRRSVGLDSSLIDLDEKSSSDFQTTDESLNSDSYVYSLRKKRDASFRPRVLQAYGRNCAVCGSDLRLDDALFDLEAAHIKWHRAGGPDTVPNGLALCGFHHKSLDRGAWSINPSKEKYLVKISPQVNGTSRAVELLLEFEGKQIRLPRKIDQYPSREFIKWHESEVFRQGT